MSNDPISGQSSSSLVSFYGAPGVPLRAGAAQAAVAGSAGATYTSAEQTILNNCVTLTNELRAAAVALGLIKGAA